MKILIDIGHPAHVHYFRNFIKIMEGKNHNIKVIARDKEVAHKLLENYNINYHSRGSGGNSLFNKLIYFFEGDLKIYKLVKVFKPDLLLSFASPYLAQVSKFTGIPHIVFDDTEHNRLNHYLYAPLSTTILNPTCFTKSLGIKQIFFNSYMELSYLHPNYFKPLQDVTSILDIKSNEKFIILRFVSWSASHDIGEKGLSYNYKLKLINELSKFYKVFISSESDLPAELKKYKLNINPEDLHLVLYYAQLYIGEGSTTASECSVLGTPNIYVNSLSVGYCTEQEKRYNLSFHFKNEHGVLEKTQELLSIHNLKEEWQKRRQKMLLEKIDVTAFMVWFIENYPESVKVMKENPEYQYRFK